MKVDVDFDEVWPVMQVSRDPGRGLEQDVPEELLDAYGEALERLHGAERDIVRHLVETGQRGWWDGYLHLWRLR